MRKFLIAALFCTGTGYAFGATAPNAPVADLGIAEPVAVAQAAEVPESTQDVVLPITLVDYYPWMKTFGTFVDDGRFFGYHAGDDIETDQIGFQGDVPVYAIADGVVAYTGWVSGYGGVVIVTHVIDGQSVSSLYGHVDDTAPLVEVGDHVSVGQEIAVLGEHLSHETDGRRMHLHFAMWEGSELKFPGYVATLEELDGWVEPSVFLEEHGAL